MIYGITDLKWFGLFIDGELWYVFPSFGAASERMHEILTVGRKEIRPIRISYYK